MLEVLGESIEIINRTLLLALLQFYEYSIENTSLSTQFSLNKTRYR